MTKDFVLVDGFDYYPNIFSSSNGLQARWSIGGYLGGGNWHLVPGRYTGQALQLSGYINTDWGFVQRPLVYQNGTNANTSVLATGFGLRLDQFNVGQPNNEIMAWTNGGQAGTLICGLGLSEAQQYYFWVGDDQNIVATASPLITVGAWHSIGVELTIDPSAGSMNFYMDGQKFISYTGNTGVMPCNNLVLGFFKGFSQTGIQTFDDLYVSNGTTQEGERQIILRNPVGNGVSTQWTANTGGVNWAMANAVPVEEYGNNFVYANTVGYSDIYQMSTLPIMTNAISCVQVVLCGAKDNSETRIIAPQVYSGGTTVNLTNAALTNSYLYFTGVLSEDPNTSAPWTVSGVNGSQVGQVVVE